MTASLPSPQHPLYEVTDGAILVAGSPFLSGLRLSLPENAVTVVLGPSATGKSLLLSALSGHRMPTGIELAGSWRRRGAPRSRWEGAEVALLRQQPVAGGAIDWERIFDGAAHTLLLDEPCRLIRDEARPALIERLRRHAQRGAAVVVTHDLGFAAAVADQVLLLCAGRIEAFAPAADFFRAPPTPLAAQFVRQGNCWPRPTPPSHFRWLLDGRLAGMGRPGLLGQAADDVAALIDAGVILLITLTEQPPPWELLREVGLEARHLPVPDMGVPSIAGALSACDAALAAMARGAVVFHCQAGLGRTGTLLAALLTRLGRNADQAIAEVRRSHRGYIQTEAQEQFLRRFADATSGSPG